MNDDSGDDVEFLGSFSGLHDPRGRVRNSAFARLRGRPQAALRSRRNAISRLRTPATISPGPTLWSSG